jgi:hypothetical protein
MITLISRGMKNACHTDEPLYSLLEFGDRHSGYLSPVFGQNTRCALPFWRMMWVRTSEHHQVNCLYETLNKITNGEILEIEEEFTYDIYY